MRVVPEVLLESSHDFIQASKDIQSVVQHLEETMSKLEQSWEDAGQEMFFEYYREWRKTMGGFSAILDEIARHLAETALRFEEIDKP